LLLLGWVSVSLNVLDFGALLALFLARNFGRPYYQKIHLMLSILEKLTLKQLILLKMAVFPLVPRYDSYVGSILAGF